MVPRVLLIALFGWLWWQTFPFLSHNAGRMPAGEWTLADIARVVALCVYPTYLVLFEGLSGHVSDFVRELANGAVSWASHHYVDLRPKSASYGCALYKLLREQIYALLMAPLVLLLAVQVVSMQELVPKVVLGVLAVALAIDMLAACTRGGFVNVWTSALAERVEARYLLMRAGLLKRCNAWDGR